MNTRAGGPVMTLEIPPEPDLVRLQRHAPSDLALPDTRDLGRNSELVEQVTEGVDVREAREVGQSQLLLVPQSADSS